MQAANGTGAGTGATDTLRAMMMLMMIFQKNGFLFRRRFRMR
jgi:hypothetical protein